MDAFKDTKPLFYTILIIIILSILGFFAYSNILHAPFVFDDDHYIVNNPEIRDLSNFKDTYGTRYVGFLSFAINYYFNGLNTFGYHLVNIVIHILNAILVYVLVQITLQRVQGFKGSRVQENTRPLDSLTPRILPFAVSLIFLVHPIQTQAVSYITQRFASLAAFFYLLAIVLYVKARVLGFGGSRVQENTRPPDPLTPGTLYVFSILSAILAMKTKEISFTLPIIIILYEFTFFSAKDSRTWTRFLYLAPFLLTLAIIPLNLFFYSGKGIAQHLSEQQVVDINRNSPAYDHFITQFKVTVTYIRLLFLPVNQNYDYDYPMSHSVFEVQALLSFLFLLSIVIAAIYLYIRSWKRDNGYGLLISFGILWFFITLSVEARIRNDIIFEHRVYLPSAGFTLSFITSIFYGFEYLERRLKRSLFAYLLIFILTASIFLLFAAIKRNMVWKSEEGIYLDTVNKSPNKARPHNYLAGFYEKTGRIDEAIKEVNIALSLPSSLHYFHHYNLGIGYQKKGLLNDAVDEFLSAIKLKVDYLDAYRSLGIIFVELGRFEDAEKNIKKALELQPTSNVLHNTLGNIYLMQGKYRESIVEYEKAFSLDKNNVEAIYNIAMAYENIGSKDKSIEFYKKFIEMSHPDYENEKERAKTRIKELTKND
ncbi:MAG: tetratricopeptide repeat protein [Deltaproteobacteria bacterium]|nr:tetratricopeptide repeat protein [Deltaproteobacteria bacterium]